jgi:hypothetical protein
MTKEVETTAHPLIYVAAVLGVPSMGIAVGLMSWAMNYFLL